MLAGVLSWRPSIDLEVANVELEALNMQISGQCRLFFNVRADLLFIFAVRTCPFPDDPLLVDYKEVRANSERERCFVGHRQIGRDLIIGDVA